MLLLGGKIKGNITDQTDLKNALDNKANTSDIPTKTSELQNDSNFVNNATLNNTLANYQEKLTNAEITLSNYTSNFTNFNGNTYRIGNIGIISFSGSLQNLNAWREFEICTMNVTALKQIYGVLSAQNTSQQPINIDVQANSNKLYVHPFENQFTAEKWFRGLLVFIIKE